MPALYSTQARAVGGRAGHVESLDGLLKVDLALPKEMGGKGGATNPEQLFAAGYAACFENAVRFLAGQQKIGLTGAAVTSTVELHPRAEGGFRLGAQVAISKNYVTLKGTGRYATTFQKQFNGAAILVTGTGCKLE
ncbi:MAG: Ohr family peroxiredoxin, partial [Rhodoferax sp.]|nr:Ohr family peroxiredoxin [Rhodoferax sp.]